MVVNNKVLCINKYIGYEVHISSTICTKYNLKIDNIALCNRTEILRKLRFYDIVVINTERIDEEINEVLSKIKNRDVPIVMYASKENVLKDMNLFDRNDISDYIFKGATAEEFCFRLRVDLNNNKRHKCEEIYLEDRKINLNDGYVETPEEIKKLTSREVSIVKKLYENKNHIVSMDELSNELWNTNAYGYENTIMVYIGRIRKKIEKNPAKPKYITTIKGLGYRLANEA